MGTLPAKFCGNHLAGKPDQPSRPSSLGLPNAHLQGIRSGGPLYPPAWRPAFTTPISAAQFVPGSPLENTLSIDELKALIAAAMDAQKRAEIVSESEKSECSASGT